MLLHLICHVLLQLQLHHMLQRRHEPPRLLGDAIRAAKPVRLLRVRTSRTASVRLLHVRRWRRLHRRKLRLRWPRRGSTVPRRGNEGRRWRRHAGTVRGVWLPPVGRRRGAATRRRARRAARRHVLLLRLLLKQLLLLLLLLRREHYLRRGRPLRHRRAIPVGTRLRRRLVHLRRAWR